MNAKEKAAIFDTVLHAAQRYDDRSSSDEARWWSDHEAGMAGSMEPEARGAWKASLELAFDMGKLFARIERDPSIELSPARRQDGA